MKGGLWGSVLVHDSFPKHIRAFLKSSWPSPSSSSWSASWPGGCYIPLHAAPPHASLRPHSTNEDPRTWVREAIPPKSMAWSEPSGDGKLALHVSNWFSIWWQFWIYIENDEDVGSFPNNFISEHLKRATLILTLTSKCPKYFHLLIRGSMGLGS